tara:strand:- start:656 stop:1594 length:939 start_codon:yes stop_codon:yes gene_type:complete
MLELNGKEEKVNKAYLAKLGIEKFPVTFKLVNRLKKFDTVNKRWQIPRSFNLENTFSTYTDDGSLLFRYYKTKRPKEIGNKVVEDYYPLTTQIGHTGELTLNEKDMDLIAFLALSDRNATSKYRAQDKQSFFFTENKAKEAKTASKLFKKENRVTTLLLSLSLEKITDIAKSYQIPGIDSMDIEEIQMSIKPFISGRDLEVKLDTFLDKVGSDGDVELLALINDSIEFNIIKHNKDIGKWYLLTATGKEDEAICEVRGGEEGISRLATYLIKFDDKNWRQYLRTKVEEAKLETLATKAKSKKTSKKEASAKA